MSQSCYHCGEEVPVDTDHSVEILGKQRSMCCPGCQSVAQTIVESGLVSYYQYRTAPADKADIVPEQLAQLTHYDNDEVQKDFVIEHNGSKEVTLSLDGVSCAACAWLIEKRLSKHLGVMSIQVNTSTHRALLKWDPLQVTLSELLTEIQHLGYKAAPFEANTQETFYQQSMKQYLYRIGLAGLATMQVMMLAVALYFEVFGDLDTSFRDFFRWVSFLFATPVLLYSASPFYVSAWRSLKARTLGMDVPVSIALIFAYVASFVATVTKQGEVFFESISMFTFFLLVGRFLEMRARRQAAAASANLLKLIPAMATTLDGENIAVSALKPGQRLRVRPGEHIPADGKIIAGNPHVDESMLTGESMPIRKSIDQYVYAGTLNKQEAFEFEVTHTKMESRLASIVRLQDEAQMSKPKIAHIADVVARYFVAGILIIAAMTWFYWHQHQPEDAFWIMLSVLVATCPCALSLATPTAITCSASQMGKLGIILRKGHVFETLCEVNHLVVDKTGTLTHGNVSISHTQTYSGWDESSVLSLAAALEAYANHPIANAFSEYFDSSIQLDNVENLIGSGIQANYQNQHLRIGRRAFAAPYLEESFESSVYLSLDGKAIARFDYHDPIRDDAKPMIASFQALGVKVTLLSGDNSENCHRVARETGIEQVVSAASPEQKLAYLQQMPAESVTMMVGDGINDAPTLAGAHLSVAMGGGTDIAKSSADMVLLGDKLSQLIKARELALKTRTIIRENLAWALGYNALVLPLAVCGWIAPYFAVLGMSVSSIIVVSNSLRLLKQVEKR
ncbi:Cu2+-exporting ATPase [Vibrio xiamenensis]|uniref:P-type Cu(2+) transporter n=1 Tax=Vibrio xiamenensis TaxID=861298 RepID=A0A1G7YDF3_9VIBR|nr:heavy metal translocating P-type ATPase [Vibrio xiamenensis]SDG94346.1 Cu2+-exporting ATPase [Vibrio xiamenensis]